MNQKWFYEEKAKMAELMTDFNRQLEARIDPEFLSAYEDHIEIQDLKRKHDGYQHGFLIGSFCTAVALVSFKLLFNL